MAKAKEKALPKGIRTKNGSFEARAVINGIKINLYGSNLDALIKEFEEAKERARETLDYKKNNITLNEWFEEWFTEVKQHRIKQTSVAPMKNNFKRTFGFYIGSMKLKDIKPLDVQKAMNAMEQNNVSQHGMREALGRLRECMDFALGNQLIRTNPCLSVEVPWTFKQTKEEIALTQEEQDNFLAEMEDNWYKEMFYFMCLTGVRIGELGGVKWSDIDFRKKVIHIRRSLSCSYYNGEKTMMLVTPKTICSIRDIPFLGEMEEILKSQKKKQDQLKAELGSRWRSTGEFENLVFTTGMGSPCVRYIAEKEIKKALKRMREKEGFLAVQENRMPREIRDFHPHSLRHTFATRCFENKMEPKVVQKLMGHSSISITLNIYTHVLDNMMEEEIKKFGVAKTQIPTPEDYYNAEIQKAGISAMSHNKQVAYKEQKCEEEQKCKETLEKEEQDRRKMYKRGDLGYWLIDQKKYSFELLISSDYWKRHTFFDLYEAFIESNIFAEEHGEINEECALVCAYVVLDYDERLCIRLNKNLKKDEKENLLRDLLEKYSAEDFKENYEYRILSAMRRMTLKWEKEHGIGEQK